MAAIPEGQSTLSEGQSTLREGQSSLRGGIAILALALALALVASCAPVAPADDADRLAARNALLNPAPLGKEYTVSDSSAFKELVLGGGCFWCLEAVYELVPGVADVENGYAGGSRAHPSYEEVSTGLTGHAEVVKIRYDPAVVTLARLLEIFWTVHDPTTEDRQGADVGEQYRSIAFFADEDERRAIEASLREAQKRFRDPVVTQVEPLKAYWPAEAYHQDYFRRNPEQGYCRVVIAPKVDKFRTMK
ncbi:MAG: peptide-methionine (S)-S-oxide reductase MsrA [Spirochaetia bacterium]|nr:peptide-methionine (S)-S-oxide reductase MsrA [Spirochaetia bacterium]